MIAALHEFPFAAPVVTDADEAELVRRAQAREVRAFELLYRRHVPRIHAVCLRLAADPRRAEDFTQTAFIQAWQKLPLFRGESSFASWLHRLAVNTALMDFRSTRRREARVIGTEDPVALEIPSCPPPAGVRLDLEAAIATLPPQARAVFVLHDVEGYTHEEIAGLMELQTGTTKAQLHRARQLLQEALQ
jgi:RNA polymerase sigma factor (sigma-70 family)